MAVRCVTALVGGYAFAAAVATLVSRLLPIARVEAVMWGMIGSFLIYAAIALWCFREGRLARVVGIVWGTAASAALAVWTIGPRA